MLIKKWREKMSEDNKFPVKAIKAILDFSRENIAEEDGLESQYEQVDTWLDKYKAMEKESSYEDERVVKLKKLLDTAFHEIKKTFIPEHSKYMTCNKCGKQNNTVALSWTFDVWICDSCMESILDNFVLHRDLKVRLKELEAAFTKEFPWLCCKNCKKLEYQDGDLGVCPPISPLTSDINAPRTCTGFDPNLASRHVPYKKLVNHEG